MVKGPIIARTCADKSKACIHRRLVSTNLENDVNAMGMEMTKSASLSEIQLLNLSALLAIRDGINRDAVATCCQFGLEAGAVNFLSKLSTDQILGFVANFGNESLFLPRSDLVTLLQLPLPLTESVAAVRPPQRDASP